ncbi:MAG: PAS domain S-box protein [Bacteroidales bacterium]|nr:PAS domain S-box protein [Bacteroidales bacterium]
MNGLRQEMNAARDKLFKYSILSILILAIPAIVFSLIQIIKYGFDINYVLFCSMFILISAIFLLRNKLSIILKSHIVGSLFLISGFIGNLFFGFSGGHFLCLIGIAIITVLYGKKLGIIYSIIALLGYIFIEYIILNNLFVREIDFNAFNANFISWIYALFTIFITAIILISSINYINKAFISLVKKLDKNNIELNILNSSYKDVFVKVEESERKYKAIFQTLNEGVILTDQEGNIIDCNKATEDILGASKSDLLSVNLHSKNFSFIYPNLSPVPDEECPGVKTLEKGVSISGFEVGLQQEDQIKWISLSSEPLKIEGYGVFLTLHDLTQKKKMEQEQVVFNRYFEAFLEHITDYVIFKDINGKIVFCSQSLAQLTGYSSWKNLIGKNYSDILPEESALQYESEDKIILSTGKRLEGKVNMFLGNDSEIRYEQTNKVPLLDEDMNVVGIISISRDITDLKREKDLIEEQEEKFNLILNSTAEGIYGLDLNGNCTFVNQSCIEMLGYSKGEELLGQNMHNLIHHSNANGEPISQYDCNINHTLQHGEEMSSDKEVFWKKDGTSLPVEYFSYLQINEGKIVGAVVTFLDITERKERSKQIINSTKKLQKLNSDKDKFIRILAHDLKNPFNSIIGFSEYIIDNLEEIDKNTIKEFTSIINESSENAYQLLEEILLWLKVQSGKLSVEKKEVELRQIVLNVIEGLKTNAQTKDIKLSCSIPESVYIESDINMLKTILRNLINNSIKFTDEKGEIEVKMEEKEDKINIIVSDNGVGMSKEEASRIFTNDSYQTKEGTNGEKGTGLGLTIIKDLVQSHDETIWAESEIGKGSDFIFTMPKAEHKN